MAKTQLLAALLATVCFLSLAACSSSPEPVTKEDLAQFEVAMKQQLDSLTVLESIVTDGSTRYANGSLSRFDFYQALRDTEKAARLLSRLMDRIDAKGELLTIREDYSTAAFTLAEGCKKLMIALDSGELADVAAAKDQFDLAASLVKSGDQKLLALRQKLQAQ